MTLASQLKQKSRSINLDRLKSAAQAKKDAREKAARQSANALLLTERKKALDKKRLEEQKLLFKWLEPGLLLSWNQEDCIECHPRSDEELKTAKKFFSYKSNHANVVSLNSNLKNLEVDIKVLRNRLLFLDVHSSARMPSIEFDLKTLLNSFKSQDLFFDKLWRRNFRNDALYFESEAKSNYKAKMKRKLADVYEDPDILEVKDLAETLKPCIEIFRDKYWKLLNSPSFVSGVQYLGTFEGVNYVDLVARRDYKLAVARHVLLDMNIHCRITYPDIIGKFMAAFAIAAGEELFKALDEHITHTELIEKVEDYKQIMNSTSINQSEIQLSDLDGLSVARLVSTVFSSLEKVEKILKTFDFENLKIKHGQVDHIFSIRIDNLSATNQYPNIDRLAYDIQWLSSIAGQKFKKQFTKYLEDLANIGKFTAKFKVFSVNDELLIELPSGKEFSCDMTWDSFSSLLKLLEFEITEVTTTGIVKLKWLD